jgi:NADH-quinone oxidoreductase subunit G
MSPLGESKPGWKVLRVLGNISEQSGFNYQTSAEVRDELKQQIDRTPFVSSSAWYEKITMKNKPTGLTCITEWPIYRSDNIVRRAEALQKSATAHPPMIGINQSTAEKYGLSENQWAIAKQGDHAVTLPVKIDPRVPADTIVIPAGFPETASMAHSLGPITLKAVS